MFFPIYILVKLLALKKKIFTTLKRTESARKKKSEITLKRTEFRKFSFSASAVKGRGTVYLIIL